MRTGPRCASEAEDGEQDPHGERASIPRHDTAQKSGRPPSVAAPRTRRRCTARYASAPTVTFSFTVTSGCSFTSTSWVPTSFNGSGMCTCLRSIGYP